MQDPPVPTGRKLEALQRRFTAAMPAIMRNINARLRPFNRSPLYPDMRQEALCHAWRKVLRYEERQVEWERFTALVGRYAAWQVLRGTKISGAANRLDLATRQERSRDFAQPLRLAHDDEGLEALNALAPLLQRCNDPAELAVLAIDLAAWKEHLSAAERFFLDAILAGESGAAACRAAGKNPHDAWWMYLKLRRSFRRHCSAMLPV